MYLLIKNSLSLIMLIAALLSCNNSDTNHSSENLNDMGNKIVEKNTQHSKEIAGYR